jgi:hypothetical protein
VVQKDAEPSASVPNGYVGLFEDALSTGFPDGHRQYLEIIELRFVEFRGERTCSLPPYLI